MVLCCDQPSDNFFSYDYNPDIIAPGATVTLKVRNGCANFTWVSDNADFTFGDATTSGRSNTILAAAGATWETANITVTDSCGNTATGSLYCVDYASLTVADCVASPSGTTFYPTQEVSITCATAGSTIRYTTDGTIPNSSSIEYTGAITFSETTTLKAIGFKAGMIAGAIESEVYTYYVTLNDVMVAVGIDGKIRYSEDVETWTTKTGVSHQINEVIWVASLGLFIAVKDTGESPQNVGTSPDGETWTEIECQSGDYRSVAWSGSLSLLVVVGDGVVQTSSDGITWTARTMPELNIFNSVDWSSSLELFVAVAQNGTYRVMTSANGIDWTSRTAAEANQWNNVLWISDLNLFVAVSQSGTNRAMTSTDGTTWTARNIPTVGVGGWWISLAWSSDLNLLVAIGYAGDKVATSPDGINWTVRTPSANLSWTGVSWNDGEDLFVAVNSNINTIGMKSADGINWSAIEIASSARLLDITYAP